MNQPEREPAGEVVVTVDRRAMRWVALLAALVVMLGLGVWMGLSVSRMSPSAFDPYATSEAPIAQVSAPEAAAKEPVLMPPPRPGFEPEAEDFAVMGDPEAPITIVEYSDYQ